MRHGAAVLGQIAEEAVRRLLERGEPGRVRRLFTDEERQELADALAAVNSTADLLGRSRIRRRLEQARQHAEKFSEDDATDFACFDDRPLSPLAPRAAIDWFRSLLPGISGDADEFAADQEREAFRLAATTEEALLEKVHDIIGRVLETGEGVSASPDLVQQVLDEAGVSPRNPQYAECVVRSNLMNAYNEGSHREMQELADDFPAWKWLGIRDGRQRKSHEVHFDKYFPVSVTFAEVRDSVKGEYDGYNDRCTSQAIYKSQWAKLQQQGASFSSFSESIPVPPLAQQRDCTCGPSALAAVLRLYGRTASEGHLSQLLGTTEDDGTPPDALVAGCRKLGLDVAAQEGMTLAQLERAVIRGQPVILCCQAGDDPQEIARDQAGHWMVAVGRGGGSIELVDPAVGEKVKWPREKLERRWRDEDGAGRKWKRFGVVVRGLAS